MRHIEGALKLIKEVSKTAGARGGLIWLKEEKYPTKDGFNVAKNFKLEDEEENVGCTVLKEIAMNTAYNAGDGTTLTCIITGELLSQNPTLEDIEDIKEDIKTIKDDINSISNKIKSKEDLFYVAKTSSNGDIENSRKISELIYKIGENGILIPEQSNEEGVQIDIVDGFSFNSGYLDGSFVNTSRGNCELLDPIIFIKDRYNISDAKPFLEEAHATNRPIVLFGLPDDQALLGIQNNHLQGNIVACCVGINGQGKSKDRFINDLRAVTNNGCESIIVKRHQTIIKGFNDISEYVNILKQEETPTKYETDEQLERIARLESKIGVIKIGAKTQSSEREHIDRVEDMIRACQSALKSGIVKGCGITLYNLSVKNEILKNALQKQYKVLCENANLEANGKEYNLKTRKECDLIEEGIYDVSHVLITAIENAVSATETLMNIKGIV